LPTETPPTTPPPVSPEQAVAPMSQPSQHSTKILESVCCAVADGRLLDPNFHEGRLMKRRKGWKPLNPEPTGGAS
jgi:hypothetical protein